MGFVKMDNQAMIKSFLRPNRVQLLTLRRRTHQDCQFCLPRNSPHIRQLDDYTKVIDLEAFPRLTPNVEGALVEVVPVVGEDSGLGALAGFEVPSAEHFRYLARIFHYHCGNNIALHLHLNSLDFQIDLTGTITARKMS